MEVAARLSLYGFERKDLGDQGAVFLRYETPQKDERKSEIRESPMYYGGRDRVSYVLSVPIPLAKQVVGAVIVERTSKSRYTVSAWVNGKIANFSATSVDDIQRAINKMQMGAKE